MSPLVPRPNFEYIASILTDQDLQAMVHGCVELHGVIRTSTQPDPHWDGYVGNYFIGGIRRPNARYKDWDFRLWQDWRWVQLAYTYAMSGECQKRGLECRSIPPEWGYNLRLAQLEEADANLREHWPGSGKFIPPWLFDARLGRQHQAALVAHDVYYRKFFPNVEYE